MTTEFQATAKKVEDVLADLISYLTICETPNDELIRHIKQELETLGFRTQAVPDSQSKRHGLLASIGPETDDGMIFSAHSDVVPVEGQPWTSDPFKMVNEHGKLTGRGTSDMKGFLACSLVAARHAAAKKHELKRPLHILVSYDEEIGCVGIRPMLASLKAANFKAAGCIIGEPTEMKMITGHKGKLAVQVECKGVSGHSSNPDRGCNAILLACEVIKVVQSLQQSFQVQENLHDKTYEVPYNTAQVGLINGGVALNIIPDHCEFKFEMRLLPPNDGYEYVQKIREAADNLLKADWFKQGTVEVKALNGYPGLATDDNHEFVKFLEDATSIKNNRDRINFGTEGGLVQKAFGIPVVVCGPGSIDRAHKADEWVTTAELNDCVQFLTKIIDKLAE